jgi:zinc and cadmium transporter
LAGGILAFLGLENLPEILPVFLAIAVSNFIYVAMADLVPTLHKQTLARATIQQIVMIGAGVWVMSEALGASHR